MRIYFDSSALAKRYLNEKGTQEVLTILRSSEEIIISVISTPELISAFNRLRRDGKLPSNLYETFKRELIDDISNTTLINISMDIIIETIKCLEKEPIRASDAIHLASALISGCDYFVSSDQKQTKAAKSIGLRVKFISS